MRTPRAALVVLAGGLALAACSLASRTPEMRYYVLAVPEAAAVPLAAPVRVVGFSIDEPYTSRQLAYRTSPYRLDYYSYHRWAGSPQSMVASAVRDYLEQVPHAGDRVPIEISGHIRRLEEVDDASGWFGELALDVTDRRGDTVILEHAFSEREPAATRNPEAVVAALSRALGHVLQRLVTALADADAANGRPAAAAHE